MSYLTPSGNLVITADNALRAELADKYRDTEHGGYFGAEMLVSEAYHERLFFIRPECIGALTDAPIVTDEADYSDEAMSGEYGGPIPYKDAKVWWFPEYCLRDPWRELANKGRVVFQLAPSVKES